jgi:hypothetical protein
MAKRDAEDALADQGGHLVLDTLRRPYVAEAGREAPDQADGPVRGPEQQRAGIRGDRPTVEAGDHGAAFDGCKIEQRRATPCPHREPPLRRNRGEFLGGSGWGGGLTDEIWQRRDRLGAGDAQAVAGIAAVQEFAPVTSRI